MAILPIPGRDRRAPLTRDRRRASALAAAGLLTLTSLALAPAALAANPTVTTPYPSISVAPGSKVSFDINVTAAAYEQVGLALSGVPADWTATLRGGGYVVNAVQADVDGKATARLDVQVPGTAPDGVTHITIAATAGGARTDLLLTLNVTATAAGNVTLTSDYPSLQGLATTTFTFNLTLHNDTAEDQTFGVTAVGPSGWEVNATLTGQSQAASAIVQAGSSAGISVSAKPSTDATAGDYQINVRATVGDQEIDDQLSVKVTGTNSVTVTTPDQRLSNSGSAGSSITQQLVIQNGGTQPLQQVTVSATAPTDWKVTFDTPTIDTIAANDSATVTATIVPSNDAIAGDYVITYRAHNADADGTVDIRMTIDTSPLFGFVGLALIAVVLFGLWWVFQRYGRR